MKKEELIDLETETNWSTIPMSHKIKKLTNKDLMDILEQERREHEKWQFDAFYPLSYSNHINY